MENEVGNCINGNISLLAIALECQQVTDRCLRLIGQPVVDALRQGLSELSPNKAGSAESAIDAIERMDRRIDDLERSIRPGNAGRPKDTEERLAVPTQSQLTELAQIHFLAGKCLHGSGDWFPAETRWADLARQSLADLLKRINQLRPDLSSRSERRL